MRGIKCGVDEIDILAIRETPEGMERWHVEVQASFRPIGYIGGDSNARRRDAVAIAAGVAAWVEKKFTQAPKVVRRQAIAPGADWRFVVVQGHVREPKELELMRAHGVTTIRYADVLADLMVHGGRGSSSAASNILEIREFARSR